MKTFFVIAILFVFLSDSNSFAQTNCYTPPTIWYRRITQPVFKWHWDGQLNGASFNDGTGVVLSTTEKQQIVRNAIIWAVNYWKSVVNSNGTVIEDMSEDTEGNGNFHFIFTSLTGQLGNTVPDLNEIQLANDHDKTWTDNYTYASANRAYDIKTVILHEIGHIFLGGGHSTWSSDDPRSLMWENYTIPFRSITQCDIQALLNLYPLFNITVDNNFTDNSGNNTHGKVKISNYLGDLTAPITIKKAPGQSVTLTAISPQTDNQNYQMIWHSEATNPSRWNRNGIYFNPDQSFTFTVSSSDNGAKYQAQLRKICNVSFQNSFVGIGNGGVINVNNTQYNSPTSSFPVVELNPITALPASGQIINGIVYNFSKWSDGNTTANRTFNPSVNATYTAQYIGKPSTYDPNTGWSLNLHHSTTVGQPIVLYWNEHPNTYVTKYQIWRKVKHNGVMGNDVLLTTKNRGTTNYTDEDYLLSNKYNSDLIFYDVRPYYSLENTYSDPAWTPVFGQFYKTSDSTMVVTKEFENSLSNFPNPFNPATNISFSIKEAGHVNIKVFDLIGQQVAELVNEEKQAGSYSVRFDASKLPSGIYIYTINSGVFTQTRKMLLMK